MDDTEKRIGVKYVLDSSGFNESLQGVNANLKLNKSALNEASVGVKAFGASTENLQKVENSLQSVIASAKQKVDLYKDSIDKTTQKMQDNIAKRDKLKSELDQEKAKLEGAIQAYGKNSEVTENCKAKVAELTEEYEKEDKAVTQNAKSIEGYTTKMNNANANATKYEGELKNVTEQIGKNNNGFLNASKTLKDHSEKLKTVGESVSAVGDKVGMLATPIVAVGAYGSKAAIDFENGMAKVGTIADTSQVSIDNLGKGVLNLSNETGESCDTIQEGLYETISSGIQTGDAMNFLATATKAAKGGFTDTATSVDGLTTVINAYGLKAQDATKISNQMMVAQNLGKTTFGDMAKSIGLVADTTSACNVKTEDLFSSLAVMTAHGIDTSEAISGLREALSNIIKPSDEATNEAIKLGLSFNSAHLKSVGWAEFLKEIQEKTHGNTEEMGQLFGSVQGLNSMVTLTSNSGMQLFNQSLQQMNSGTNLTDQAFNKVNNTAGAKLNKSLNELKNSSMRLGEAATPLIQEGTHLIDDLTNKLNSMDESTLKNIVDIGAWTIGIAGVAKVVGGTVKTVSGAMDIFSQLSGAIGKAREATSGATAAAEGATTATAAMGTAAEGAGAASATAAAGAEGAGAAAGGLGAAALAAAPEVVAVVAAIAAVGVGSYALYKHMTNDAIPTTDLFAKKYETTTKAMNEYGQQIDVVQEKTVNFTESTKKNVSAYMTMDDNVKKTMLDMAVNSDNFSKQTKSSVIQQFTDMTNKVGSLDANMKDKNITDFTNMVTNTTQLTSKNRDAIVSEYTQMVNKVSGLTQQQKQDTIKKFSDTMLQSVGVTKNQANNVAAQFTAMGNKIKSGMETQYNNRLTTMKSFFAKSDALSIQDEQKIIQNMQSSNNKQQGIITGYEQKIASIYANASSKHRNLTAQEQAQVNQIQDNMRTHAITSLSDTSIQSKVLLERMKSYGTSITEEQASNIIKNANKQRDGAVSAANKQYNDTVAELVYERDVSHTISADKAEKCIKEAGKQRDQSIKAAQEQRTQTVSELQKMGGDAVKQMNTDTGNMLSPWDKFKQGVEDKISDLSKWLDQHPLVAKIAKGAETVIGGSGVNIPANAAGDDNFQGGLTTLHEKGYEVYNLPSGTKIFNHEASEDMVLKTANAVAENVAQKVFDSNKSNVNNMPVINFDHVTIKGYEGIKKLSRDLYNIQMNYNRGKGAI